MTAEPIDLGGTIPQSLCGACLKRMVSGGAKYEAIELAHGRVLMHAYCEHNQAGAVLSVLPGMPLRWSITVPIDVLDWQRLVRLKAATLAQWLEEHPPAGVQTSAQAPKVLQ